MNVIKATPKAHDGVIVIAVARFYDAITQSLMDGAIESLTKHGIASEQIQILEVPGAYELPIAIARALKKDKVIGAVALGCVIRGETSHYDFVAGECSLGIMQSMLTLDKPIAFGVLTTENEAQAIARTTGPKGNKGAEAADTLLGMLTLLEEIG